MDEITSCYANVEELHNTGMTGLAALVRATGLPLEIIGLVNHQVALVTQLDYEEGRPLPLVKRDRYWEAVLSMAVEQHLAGRKGSVHSIAIHPDSRRQLLPRWWGQEALNSDDDA